MASDAETTWTLDNTDGELTVHTGVAGPAAKMGHRLTLLMASWRITTRWTDGTPVGGDLTVDVDSLQVQRGDGGVTPLTGPEKAVARGNALKTLDAKRFPTIEFQTAAITASDDGYLLSGVLSIHGVTRPQDITLTVTDTGTARELSCTADVRQSDFGIKAFSMMLGAMKVDDNVTVSFRARHARA